MKLIKMWDNLSYKASKPNKIMAILKFSGLEYDFFCKNNLRNEDILKFTETGYTEMSRR